MNNTLRSILAADVNMINIAPMIPNLRRRQYLNSLEELHQELSVLANLHNIDLEVKSKIIRSLRGVSKVLETMRKKNSF